MNDTACVLCGNERTSEVRVSLARWRDPRGGMFSAIPRCMDRKACRARSDEIGDPWPVIDPDEPSIMPGRIG